MHCVHGKQHTYTHKTYVIMGMLVISFMEAANKLNRHPLMRALIYYYLSL